MTDKQLPLFTGEVMPPSEAKAFVRGRRWQFAKSMPQWPHEYTVRSWKPGETDAFFAFALLIVAEGEVKPWPTVRNPRYRHHYLRIGKLDYWWMETLEPFEQGGPTVINRAYPWVPPDAEQ